MLLFDGGAEPLAAFGPQLTAKAARTLQTLGVELHLHTLVTHIDADGPLVRDKAGTQTRYDAGTVLWTAGVEAHPSPPYSPRQPAPNMTAPGRSPWTTT